MKQTDAKNRGKGGKNIMKRAVRPGKIITADIPFRSVGYLLIFPCFFTDQRDETAAAQFSDFYAFSVPDDEV
jgi:hypothetical protein